MISKNRQVKDHNSQVTDESTEPQEESEKYTTYTASKRQK